MYENGSFGAMDRKTIEANFQELSQIEVDLIVVDIGK